MDKKVGSVDLDELRKAREELNQEIGVETDPDMYSDYNPNRATDADISEEEINVDVSNSENGVDVGSETSFTEGYSETPKSDAEDDHPQVNKNLDKYDIFSAFEVRENVKDESFQRTTNLENLEDELSKSIDSDDSSETDESDDESNMDSIRDVEGLEEMLDSLLAELDEELAGKDESDDDSTENLSETSEEKSIEDLSNDYLASINVEPKFDEENKDEDEIFENDKENQEDEQPREDRLGSLMKKGFSSAENSEIAEENEGDEESISDADASASAYLEDLAETQKTDEVEEMLETVESQEVDDSENDTLSIDSEENTIEEVEDEESSDDIVGDFSIDNFDAFGNFKSDKDKKDTKKTESTEIESYDASKARPSTRKSSLENRSIDGDTEIITDYNQLREILQKELKESEKESEERIIDEDDDGVTYSVIDEFKFIDEIATDEFRNSDKFSYIMGKNEKGEMVYGNFREHYNLAVFGKNDQVINSFLNSMVLSLCLKNSTSDINFVMIDSDINSSFEVYNKSSYLYFNRIAKTNKEILDTLIEITKELDLRYERLAEAGMANAEQFNDMAKETETTPMTHLLVIFNNYTSASQATYIDKINACLYQILKFGRLVGIYAVVSAALPIETSQVNYNLSSRISFKSDHESKYTVGVSGTHKLPDENDAIYFNISRNTTEHVKIATITDTELDLIIKELEE